MTLKSLSTLAAPKSGRGVKLLIWLGALGALAGLALFPPVAGVGTAFTQALEGSLTQLSVPEESYAGIKTRRKAADLPMPALSFNGYELFSDKKAKTYYYSASAGDDNPSVKFSALSPDLLAVFSAFKISPVTIGQNARHSFIVYNDKYYCEYYLRVTTLPLLSMESSHPGEDGDDFIGDRDSVVDISLFNNSPAEAHTRRLIKSGAEIHVRGASSRKYPQHSYKM
ncbi:MAG: hypothetical protein LBB52_00640, partial [Desulfovibrio sp.]|nr:hypothetical protein [Desulfovibrio sp.]